MLWLARLRSGFRARFRASRLEHEIDAELSFAHDELTARYQARGLTREAARGAAGRGLGGPEHNVESGGARGGAPMLETLGRDLGERWRGLSRMNRATSAARLGYRAT